jgi:pantoate--beta-alanine ligase
MAKGAGADIVFYPSRKDMYPEGYKTYLEVKELQDKLCGGSRPGHFRGVATVVAKLFNIVQPHNAYFGQKDAQQCIIIKQMARDLNIPVNIRILRTFRERDGLAMSSRNSYLSAKERKAALVVPEVLREIKKNILSGERNVKLLYNKADEFIKKEPLARLDYFSFSDDKTLNKITELSGNVLVSAAVRIGKTRLIDNFKIGIK